MILQRQAEKNDNQRRQGNRRRNDPIGVTFPPLTPEQVMEDREDRAAIYAAIGQLPLVQARRVYAHYILGISRADLARAEGVVISRISKRATLAFGSSLVISPYHRQVLIDGTSIDLTRKEFDLLHHFAHHPHQVFSTDQLYEQISSHEDG